MLQLTVGIDIGGTNTKFGLVDSDGRVVFQDRIPTANPDIHEYVGELYEGVQHGLSTLGQRATLLGIGVGTPKGNYFTGTIENAPNLPWPGRIDMAQLLNQAFNLPVELTNDANAAAMGEMLFGGAKRMRDFVVITLGTGLGSGIVSNGELVLGNDGFAGELGHVSVKFSGGRKCKCGKKGCLETYVSATGLKRTVYKLLADHHVDSELRYHSFADLNTKMIAQAANRGDALALEAFEYTGKILGAKLADTVGHCNPEAIFIMGGLALAGDLIFQPTQRHLEKNLLDIYRDKVKVLPSQLDSQTTPIIGASSLIFGNMAKEDVMVES